MAELDHMCPVNLPASIQAIVPQLVTDNGHERAETLLAILGAGPDWVGNNLTGIDIALGSQGPGLVTLQRLVQLTRDASDPNAPRVPRQHFISQCLSEQFTELVNPSAGLQLNSYDLQWKKTYLKGTAGVGYIDNFVKIDSAAIEKVWKQVEDNLPAAIAAVKDGSIFGCPDLVEVIRNTIALHFVRNPQICEIHESSFEPVYSQGVEALAKTSWSEEAFTREHGGLYPAGPEGRRVGAEQMLERLSDRFDEGVLFRLRSQDLFEKICDRFANHGLEILSPASEDREFLIGDVPGLAVDLNVGIAGYGESVGLAKATTVILPLDPQHLAALGPSNRFRQISNHEVDQLNQLEVRASKHHVFYRPSVDFKAAIDAWRAAAPFATSS